MGKKSLKLGDSLVLKDKEGRPKIILDASSPGLPSIVLKGEHGAALTLVVDGSNPRIIFSRRSGKHALAIASSGDGSVIVLYDKTGLPAVRIALDEETKVPDVSLYTKGQIKWSATPDER
jgi:hypothetical protein